jgi:hypothetical protein
MAPTVFDTSSAPKIFQIRLIGESLGIAIAFHPISLNINILDPPTIVGRLSLPTMLAQAMNL